MLFNSLFFSHDVFFSLSNNVFNCIYTMEFQQKQCSIAYTQHTMEFQQKQYIFNRISEEFNVSTFKKRYYCDKIPLEELKMKFFAYHGHDSQIFVRVDHIVLRASNELWVYLLTSHSSGRCANHLHF